MTKERSRQHPISVDPEYMDRFATTSNPWYETPEEVEAGLEWGRQKAELFRLIRKEMRRRLTKRERRCVELYFFKGLTYSEAGKATKTNPSSVHRAVQRGLRKLRFAASAGKLTRIVPKRRPE